MIEIKKYATRLEAELAKVYLESHNIECQVETDNFSSLNPNISIGLDVKLLVVDPKDKDNAMILLKDYDSQSTIKVS